MKNKILLLGFGFLGEEVCNEVVKRNCHVEKTRLHQSDGIIQLDINNHAKVKNLIESQNPEIVDEILKQAGDYKRIVFVSGNFKSGPRGGTKSHPIIKTPRNRAFQNEI